MVEPLTRSPQSLKLGEMVRASATSCDPTIFFSLLRSDSFIPPQDQNELVTNSQECSAEVAAAQAYVEHMASIVQDFQYISAVACKLADQFQNSHRSLKRHAEVLTGSARKVT